MSDEKRPIRMLHDRVLVVIDPDVGERRSSAGIVIPATAQVGKRLVWAEVELHGTGYVVLRERDIHAVAAERIEAGATGLYL